MCICMKRSEKENKLYLCHALLRKVSGVFAIKSSGAIHSELVYFCIHLYHTTHIEREKFVSLYHIVLHMESMIFLNLNAVVQRSRAP